MWLSPWQHTKNPCIRGNGKRMRRGAVLWKGRQGRNEGLDLQLLGKFPLKRQTLLPLHRVDYTFEHKKSSAICNGSPQVASKNKKGSGEEWQAAAGKIHCEEWRRGGGGGYMMPFFHLCCLETAPLAESTIVAAANRQSNPDDKTTAHTLLNISWI